VVDEQHAPAALARLRRAHHSGGAGADYDNIELHQIRIQFRTAVMVRTWDIFCSVIDNYGDIGVCWRLARQLATGPARSVRLWVDDLASFHRLCHGVDADLAVQRVAGVEIRRWDASFPEVAPADIVVEGFGVRLPDSYLQAMARQSPPPAWINLEYLSAEDWIETCHRLPSPHPQLPLIRHFFFPGFTGATGGLLIEPGLAAARDAFQRDRAANSAFWKSIGIAEPAEPAEPVLRVSLFCYANAALSSLVDAWTRGSGRILCVVPEGDAAAALAGLLGRPLPPGARAGRGRLAIAVIPFLEQDAYDRLLWACDLNLVRGEDSFVRAQLAARPLVWQAYPQEERAHLLKASAFLQRYLDGAPPSTQLAAAAFSEAWNRQSPDCGRHWESLLPQLPALAAHAKAWAGALARGPSLAETLAHFCEDRLKYQVIHSTLQDES
jgi:uncharacterized repeat protein (TIGR03837 family)